MNKESPEFWYSVKPKDMILLSDQQALEDSMKAGLGPNPLEYSVSEIITVKDFNGFGTWTFFNLKPTGVKQELLLLCKEVDSNLDLRIYYQTEFQPGSRKDIINRGDFFLFQQPEDLSNFQPKDLKYTNDLTQGDNQWDMKGFGEMHGHASFNPTKTGFYTVTATIVEYLLSKGDTQDTEVLILELGNDDTLITLYAGCAVNLTEIDVYPT